MKRAQRGLGHTVVAASLACLLPAGHGSARERLAGPASEEQPRDVAASDLVLSVGLAGAPQHAVFAGGSLVTAAWSNVAIIDIKSGLTVGRLPQGSIVGALAASPAGDLLAVGSCGHGIQLWDLKTRALVRRITIPQECAESLSFSPDGVFLATGSYACSSSDGLQVWEVASGKLTRELAPGLGIRHVAFGGDGRWLAGVDDTGTARVFEWPTGREFRTYRGLDQAGYSGSAAFASRDGRYLGWLGSGVRVWDVKSNAEVNLPGAREVSVHDFPTEGPQRHWTERHVMATAAEFLEDDRLAFVDGEQVFLRQLPDGPQTVLDLAKRETQWFGDVGMMKPQSWLTIRHDGQLVAGSRETRTVLWDVAAARLREMVAPALTFPTSLRWGASGIVAWAGLGAKAQAWDDHAGKPENLGDDDAASGVAFRPDGRRLAVAGLMSMRVLDLVSHRKLSSRDFPPAAETGIAWSPDGSQIAFGSSADGFALFDSDLRPRRRIAKLEAYTSAEHVAFSPDGRWVAAGFGGPHPALRVWEAVGSASAALDTAAVTYGPQPPAFSDDSRWLASFKRGRSLVIWATGSWDVVRAWELPRTGRALSFAPKGQRLAVASDGEAAIWDAGTGRRVVTLSMPGSSEVREIAWSPDGERLVSAADDGVLRFWSALDGRLLASLYMLEGEDDWLLVTPDGRLDGSETALARLVAWRVCDHVVADRATTRRHSLQGLWRSVQAPR
jgi:WD40 repeat protein